MAHRIIFQIVATGSRVVGRAFVEAYKQANASHKYAAAAANGSTRGSSPALADRRFAGLSLDEACRILNVRTPDSSGKLTGLTMDEVAAQYKRLFDANDPAKGGSFYLQSKVVRAQERLQAQLGKAEAEAEEARAATEGVKMYKEKPPS
ncbi:mitochondrial import inner membrane translocase subunit TIM16 [Orbilia brochopaga]|uniref:Mitochondrial import inner membrane translocase subunit TIM16 n=1 Tax=Orbilia brochopaga TaxID=3140254 RepID=A0AAV9V0K6_9PEZI